MSRSVSEEGITLSGRSDTVITVSTSAVREVSLLGAWIQQIALNWLVYRLTGSAFLLGLVGFAAMIPTLLLSPLAGVLAALRSMRVKPSVRDIPHRHPIHEIREGFSYTFHFTPIRSIILFPGPVSLLGIQYAVLMPVFAERILHGNASPYGFLMTESGT